jgi:hypothetical protein
LTQNTGSAPLVGPFNGTFSFLSSNSSYIKGFVKRQHQKEVHQRGIEIEHKKVSAIKPPRNKKELKDK